jgi:hypothetical protein
VSSAMIQWRFAKISTSSPYVFCAMSKVIVAFDKAFDLSLIGVRASNLYSCSCPYFQPLVLKSRRERERERTSKRRFISTSGHGLLTRFRRWRSEPPEPKINGR